MSDTTDGADRWLDHGVEAAGTVRDVLLGSLRLSKQRIRRLTQSDGIRLNGEAPFLSSPVRPGDRVAIRLSATGSSGLRPVDLPLDVVLEDEDLLVLAKPPGLLVHPTHPSHVRTLAHGVLAHYERQGTRAVPHPVHRLDRGTSGLVLFAKHPVAHQRLDRQLRRGTLLRSYLAVVQGEVPGDEGRIDAPISRVAEDAPLRTSAGGSGAAAVTRYRVVERFAGATLLAVHLETGRTHQIRVHMADAGHPLVGDVAYGGAEDASCARPALHSWRLSFAHPLTDEPVRCEAPLPADVEALVVRLRSGGERRGGTE